MIELLIVPEPHSFSKSIRIVFCPWLRDKLLIKSPVDGLKLKPKTWLLFRYTSSKEASDISKTLA